jgi:hypothetical protein
MKNLIIALGFKIFQYVVNRKLESVMCDNQVRSLIFTILY